MYIYVCLRERERERASEGERERERSGTLKLSTQAGIWEFELDTQACVASIPTEPSL